MSVPAYVPSGGLGKASIRVTVTFVMVRLFKMQAHVGLVLPDRTGMRLSPPTAPNSRLLK